LLRITRIVLPAGYRVNSSGVRDRLRGWAERTRTSKRQFDEVLGTSAEFSGTSEAICSAVGNRLLRVRILSPGSRAMLSPTTITGSSQLEAFHERKLTIARRPGATIVSDTPLRRYDPVMELRAFWTWSSLCGQPASWVSSPDTCRARAGFAVSFISSPVLNAGIGRAALAAYLEPAFRQGLAEMGYVKVTPGA
jgi:hypothetical protein